MTNTKRRPRRRPLALQAGPSWSCECLECAAWIATRPQAEPLAPPTAPIEPDDENPTWNAL